MLCVLAALGLAVLLSSGIDISLRHMKSVSFPDSIEPFLLSFSCFSTAKVLLARRPSSGTALLDGLRFFSMAYIIYHHTVPFTRIIKVRFLKGVAVCVSVSGSGES